MVPKSWWLAGLVGMLLIASLPIAAYWLRSDCEPRCDWDGLEIDPIYQVRIVEASRDTRRFC